MKLTRGLSVLLALSLTFASSALASEANPAKSPFNPPATRAKATVLTDIVIERTAAETKVHLKADGAIKDYREVKLKKNVVAHRPERMYLDLKNVRLKGPIPAKKVGTALSRVRTGLRPDGVRVVFDSSLDGLFDYTISAEPGGLLVTIREPAAVPAVIAEPMPATEAVAEPAEVRAPAVATMQPEAKAAGDLDLLIVTADSPVQTQAWLDSPPDRQSSLQILKTAQPDQVINTSFLVTGVTPDSNGDYAVAVSFTLLDPAGKLVLSERSFAKTSGRAPANPAFILADPVLAIILGEADPAGEYTIIGSVEDLTTNKMARTSLRITLEK